jgi:hypothetical protein
MLERAFTHKGGRGWRVGKAVGMTGKDGDLLRARQVVEKDIG